MLQLASKWCVYNVQGNFVEKSFQFVSFVVQLSYKFLSFHRKCYFIWRLLCMTFCWQCLRYSEQFRILTALHDVFWREGCILHAIVTSTLVNILHIGCLPIKLNENLSDFA